MNLEKILKNGAKMLLTAGALAIIPGCTSVDKNKIEMAVAQTEEKTDHRYHNPQSYDYENPHLTYDQALQLAEKAYGIIGSPSGFDPNLLTRLIFTESSFNPYAKSRYLARGLGQLTPQAVIDASMIISEKLNKTNIPPETREVYDYILKKIDFNPSNKMPIGDYLGYLEIVHEPLTNVILAGIYLDLLVKKDGIENGLRNYNEGIGNINRQNGIPKNPSYTKKIMGF